MLCEECCIDEATETIRIGKHAFDICARCKARIAPQLESVRILKHLAIRIYTSMQRKPPGSV